MQQQPLRRWSSPCPKKPPPNSIYLALTISSAPLHALLNQLRVLNRPLRGAVRVPQKPSRSLETPGGMSLPMSAISLSNRRPGAMESHGPRSGGGSRPSLAFPPAFAFPPAPRDGPFSPSYAEASQPGIASRRPFPLDQKQLNLNGQLTETRTTTNDRPPDPVAAGHPSQDVERPKTATCPRHAASANYMQVAGAATPLMTIREVATYLHVSISTIQRVRKRDQDFPRPVQTGGSKFWLRTEIEAYLERLKARR